MTHLRRLWRWLTQPTVPAAGPAADRLPSGGQVLVGLDRGEVCVICRDPAGRFVFHGHMTAGGAARLSADLYRLSVRAAMAEAGVDADRVTGRP